MNKRVGQVIAKIWMAAGIAIVAATAGAHPLTTSKATSESVVGTIAPAERAVAVQPGAPDVRLVPSRSSQATPPTQRADQASANGTSQAANAAANQAATLGPRGCSGCMRNAATQAVTQAANQSANQAATLGPSGHNW